MKLTAMDKFLLEVDAAGSLSKWDGRRTAVAGRNGLIKFFGKKGDKRLGLTSRGMMHVRKLKQKGA